MPRRRRAAMLGLAVMLGFIVLALAATWLAPHEPIATRWTRARAEPG